MVDAVERTTRRARRARSGTRRGFASLLAGLCLASPSVAMTVSASPDLGRRVMPVMFDDAPAVSWGDGIVAAPAVGGCGSLADAGTYYLDMPTVAFPQPTDEARVAAAAVGAATGSDAVEVSRFVVRVAPGGAVPRDGLDLVGVQVGDGGPTDEVDAADVLGLAPSAISAIEIDPGAHLDARPVRTFDPFGASAPAVVGPERLIRTAFDVNGVPTGAAAVASNAGHVGAGGFSDPSGPEPWTVGAVGAVGADAVVMAAPAAVDVALAELPPGGDAAVWLYPVAAPGVLQEIDAKGTIVFTSFSAPVDLAFPSIDCTTPVGADIVEAALPSAVAAAPFASIFPVATPVGSVRTSNLTRTVQRGGAGGGGVFIGVGGGGGETCCDAPGPDANVPAPVPLPASAVLYLAALSLGAGLWRALGRDSKETLA